MRQLISRFPVLALALVFAVQSTAYYEFAKKEFIPQVRPWGEFPDRLGAWTNRQTLIPSATELSLLHPDDVLDRLYDNEGGGKSVNLVVVYFSTLRQGRAPHPPPDCLGAEGWRPAYVVAHKLSVSGIDVPLSVSEYLFKRDGAEMLVVFWYQTATRTFQESFMFQLNAISGLLMRGRTDIALVRIASPVRDERIDEARKSIDDFVQVAFPALRHHFQ